MKKPLVKSHRTTHWTGLFFCVQWLFSQKTASPKPSKFGEKAIGQKPPPFRGVVAFCPMGMAFRWFWVMAFCPMACSLLADASGTASSHENPCFVFQLIPGAFPPILQAWESPPPNGVIPRFHPPRSVTRGTSPKPPSRPWSPTSARKATPHSPAAGAPKDPSPSACVPPPKTARPLSTRCSRSPKAEKTFGRSTKSPRRSGSPTAATARRSRSSSSRSKTRWPSSTSTS